MMIKQQREQSRAMMAFLEKLTSMRYCYDDFRIIVCLSVRFCTFFCDVYDIYNGLQMFRKEH